MNTKIKISILVAISVILMYFRFGLPVFPSFLDFDFSDIPILFIGLVFSPILSVFAMAIKNILIFFIMGSFTFGVGEFANFLIGSCFVFSVSYLFRKFNNSKKYIISFFAGMLALILSGVLLNYFVLLPLYSQVLNTSIFELVGGYQIIQFLFLFIVPYNILKCIIIFFPTMFIFNKLKNSKVVP